MSDLERYITASASFDELTLVRNVLDYACNELDLVDKEFLLFLGYPRADALRLLKKIEALLKERAG